MIGTLHGLRVAAISVPTGHYVGKTRRLKVNTSVDLDVRFSGGQTTFGTDYQVAAGRGELTAIAPLIVNLTAALSKLRTTIPKKCGARLVIVTTPALHQAAAELGQIKRAAGMSTNVVEAGPNRGQAGTTAPAIAQYLRSLRSSGCEEIPQHVILYGKAIPTFIRNAQRKNAGEPDHATDYPYGLAVPGMDLVPVLGIGRLPAKTLDEARVLNAKIQQWMHKGPADSDFYTHTLVAGLFQVDEPNTAIESRDFILTLERARNKMVLSGRTVDRFYEAESNATPVFFNNGHFMPSGLISYDWKTEKADQIAAAITAGRSIVLHNDHGWDRGWGDPGFNADHVAGLTNGSELPLVWSINCYSGRYDNPDLVSFAEEMILKSGGGALGVLASSRMSNTRTNGFFSQALADTVFPQGYAGLPSFQGVRGLGASTNSAKLLTFTNLYGDGSNLGAATDLMNMYNLFGDPTLKVRVLPGEPGM